MNNLVSIVIPTRNSAEFLENCLKSIKSQTYKDIEIIVVDGKSNDNTLGIVKKYTNKIYTFVPKVKKGSFDASYKRNYGAKKGKGNYIYWLDTDMEIPKKLIEEAVSICKKGADAVILPEDSFGTGIWARAKNLERRCYWGDGMVESPRFIKYSVWNAIGGLDESLGAGGDDIDLHFRILENGYKVARSKNIVMHNEGNLKISKLFKKRFMYGRDIIKSFYKRPKASLVSYFPIRMSYVRNIKLFLNRPFDTCIFIIMRSIEYSAGLLGFLQSLRR
ncbi:MAG: glycosyltransferase [Candidatus Parcubacteria bacterium]|nr:glycosyltransferase [Candidatus Parcubacteria bacterium]